MGHLVMRFAAHTAIAKAKRTGIGRVGARMSNHAGPAALYAMMPLSHYMIGIYLAVGSNNDLPPWGARDNLLGTNPIAIAIPALEEPPAIRTCSCILLRSVTYSDSGSKSSPPARTRQRNRKGSERNRKNRATQHSNRLCQHTCEGPRPTCQPWRKSFPY